MNLGEKFIIYTETKNIIIRKEKDFFVSFDPQIFEIVKLNKFAAELLYYISLNIKYDSVLNILKLKYDASDEVLSIAINKFLNSYPSKKIINANLVELGYFKNEVST